MQRKPLTLKEAKAMEGFEFTYIYEDGDTSPAFVAKFDKEKGFSCHTLTTHTARDSWASGTGLNKDGTWCVISSRDLDACLLILARIKWTGEHHTQNRFGNAPRCQF